METLFPLAPVVREEKSAVVAVHLVEVGGCYVVRDQAEKPLFGGRRFRSRDAAEVFLEEANLRAQRVRWRIRQKKQPGPRRGQRRGPVQLTLF